MKKILVVTPQERAENLVNLLSTEGFEAQAVSVMQFVPPQNLNQVKQDLLKIKPEDFLVFISPQSVKSYLALCLDNLIFPTEHLYAIGEGTAKILLDAGSPPVRYPEDSANSVELLKLMEPLILKERPSNFFIIRGGEGNNLLQEGLKNLGAKVKNIETYARECLLSNRQLLWAALSEGLDKPVDLVVLTSFEMAQCLFELWGEQAWSQRVAVTSSSERTSKFLKSKGVTRILLLKSLSNVCIVDKLNEFLRK